MDDFLNLLAIVYYPEIKYIPFESTFNLRYVDLKVDEKRIITSVDVKNTKVRWTFLIDFKNIDEKFFSYVHNIELNNVILPKNIVCAIYHNDNKKIIFWSNIEYELLYKQYV